MPQWRQVALAMVTAQCELPKLRGLRQNRTLKSGYGSEGLLHFRWTGNKKRWLQFL